MPSNRTLSDSGVRMSGDILNLAPITGTGVSSPQAAALAAPLIAWMQSLPYALDEHGKIGYKLPTIALNHAPILEYGAGHPNEGQPIVAEWNDGAYATLHGGAPMPFSDLDMIPPYALEVLLKVLTEISVNIASAT
jgi:hypothetical protein